jgi:hypothetical protein
MYRVFSVGANVEADFYADVEQAYNIATQYLRDPYWQKKLSNENDREVLKSLLDINPKLALDFYNRHVSGKDAWIVQEHEVAGIDEYVERMDKALENSSPRKEL